MLSRYVVSQVKHNSYFLVGVALGLWVSLVLVPFDEDTAPCVAGREPVANNLEGAQKDDWEPHREERPLGPAGQPARAVQRPRYYSTELGMRAPLLAGVLSSEEMLESRASAINKTAAGLLPALRFFITASSLQVKPGRANVVGFTDTREMLKPFHALKYLADNYLEEYNFFFLVSDMTYVNARKLNELVSKLSVSQDVYMGEVAEDDTHYCTLEGGILLSNSVLRAVHTSLDWCVRNSYSARHHENIGRCILHAAHVPCTAALHSHRYQSSRDAPLETPLAAAVTAYPLLEPQQFYQVHAYVSRVHLEDAHNEINGVRAAAAASLRKHPRGYRNATWPPALRADAGLAPPPPPTRFDHMRWTRFNATHALMPDEQTVVGALSGATLQAVELIVEEATAWARERWRVPNAQLVEGAWCWEPPYALRYRLLLRLSGTDSGDTVRQVEAVRPLGAARLAPARYVTESSRVTIVLGVAPLLSHERQALDMLRRYESSCLERDANTALVLVLIGTGDWEQLHVAATALGERHRAAHIDVLDSVLPEEYSNMTSSASDELWREWVARLALESAAARLPKDALMLLLPTDADFSEDFLNRVRMNTIAGEQWYLASGFWRYAHYSHPRWIEPDGTRPQLGTGRFARVPLVLAAYRADWSAARDAWQGEKDAAPAAILAAAPLRALHAPDPALLRSPHPPPCPYESAAEASACLQGERDADFMRLNLGARHTLAKLLLQEQASLV
ncbi:unnamed protein product [Leptosia nina]|uniref:Hexosyltransferase n=1 Tax=Leptosia nina TaxID=320188 RepID=A0AAV1J4E1_9NEOP